MYLHLDIKDVIHGCPTYLGGGKSVEYNSMLVSARRIARMPLQHKIFKQ